MGDGLDNLIEARMKKKILEEYQTLLDSGMSPDRARDILKKKDYSWTVVDNLLGTKSDKVETTNTTNSSSKPSENLMNIRNFRESHKLNFKEFLKSFERESKKKKLYSKFPILEKKDEYISYIKENIILILVFFMVAIFIMSVFVGSLAGGVCNSVESDDMRKLGSIYSNNDNEYPAWLSEEGANLIIESYFVDDCVKVKKRYLKMLRLS